MQTRQQQRKKLATEKAVQKKAKKAGSRNAFGTCNAKEHDLAQGHLGQVESTPGEESIRRRSSSSSPRRVIYCTVDVV